MRDSTLAAFRDDLFLLVEVALPARFCDHRFDRWLTVTTVLACAYLLAVALFDAPAEAHRGTGLPIAQDPAACETVAMLDAVSFR